MKLPVFAFFLVCAIGAFIGWLSGYNFDYRNPVIAAACATTVLSAIVFAVAAAIIAKELSK